MSSGITLPTLSPCIITLVSFSLPSPVQLVGTGPGREDMIELLRDHL